MPRFDYRIISRTDGAYQINGKLVNNRLRSVRSSKGGDGYDRTLKQFLEVMDYGSWPLGLTETICEYLLKKYYSTKGKEGWSEKETFDLLLRLGRKPRFALEFISSIKVKYQSEKVVKK